MNTPPDIKPGARVSYSVQFLRSIGESPTSPLCHARGIVTALEPIGSITLAVIDWQDPIPEPIPERVNVANLAIVGPNPRHCAC